MPTRASQVKGLLLNLVQTWVKIVNHLFSAFPQTKHPTAAWQLGAIHHLAHVLVAQRRLQPDLRPAVHLRRLRAFWLLLLLWATRGLQVGAIVMQVDICNYRNYLGGHQCHSFRKQNLQRNSLRIADWPAIEKESVKLVKYIGSELDSTNPR